MKSAGKDRIGITAFIGERFRRTSGKSRLVCAAESFLSSPDPAYSSFFLSRFRTLRFGDAFARLLKESCLYRTASAVRDFYLRLSEGSFVLGAVNRLSLRRWFLLLFVMYLPADWLLRSVLEASISGVWDELFMAAAAGLAIWSRSLDRTSPRRGGSVLSSAIVLYIAVIFMLMCFVSPNTSIAFAGFRAQVQYTVWFMIILGLMETKEDAKALTFCFGAMVFIMSLHGMLQFAIGVEIPAHWMTSSESAVRTRVFSITGSPNIFGSLLLMAAPIAASLIYYLKKPHHKFFALCAAGLICLCDIFTFSRSSWGGLALAVVIFAILVDGRLLLVLAGAIAGLLAAVPSIASRLTFLFSKEYMIASSVGGRALRWTVGRQLLDSGSPYFGFGLGRFGGAVAMNNQVIDGSDGFRYFYMDNYYLKTMVEAGYIGLAAFIFLLIIWLLASLKAIYKSGRGFHADRAADALFRNIGNDRLLAAGIFCGLAGVLFHCYFENIFEQPYMMAYFWGLSAALIFFGMSGEAKA